MRHTDRTTTPHFTVYDLLHQLATSVDEVVERIWHEDETPIDGPDSLDYAVQWMACHALTLVALAHQEPNAATAYALSIAAQAAEVGHHNPNRLHHDDDRCDCTEGTR